MNVWTEKLDARKPGQPVIVLECGAGGTLATWDRLVPQLSSLAPVFAYDRSGMGKSEFDGEPQTILHVAETLRGDYRCSTPSAATPRFNTPLRRIGHPGYETKRSRV